MSHRPRLALASLSGHSDAEWALAGEPWADVAFLGGIALDPPTRQAARAMAARDREEFLPDDPLSFLDRQLGLLGDADLRAGFNVRAASPDPVRRAARICRDRGAILEVNAHCRQSEMCRAGAGHALLRDPDRLARYVGAAAGTGAIVSVKVRTEVDGVDLPRTVRRATGAGADVVHVDAMDSEPVVADVVEAAGGATVIANNEVRDHESVREYLAYGADAVSVGRPSDDPAVLERVAGALDEWNEDGSESNSP